MTTTDSHPEAVTPVKTQQQKLWKPSSSGMSGILIGGFGAGLMFGVVGCVVGMVLGFIAGEMLERAFPTSDAAGEPPAPRRPV